MRMSHIDIPADYQRNSQRVVDLGVEETGATLLRCGRQLLGWPDLATRDVLDLGCGTRFTQTIVNRQIPIGSYTGVEIDSALVDYLRANVRDERFSYHYWHVYNEKYNQSGERLTPRTRLPLPRGRRFDLIWMYSVITHTAPRETACLLAILRRVVRDDGALVFSAFLDPAVATFEDRLPGQLLGMAFYGGAFLRQLIAEAGWSLEVHFAERLDPVMQNLFVCRPVHQRWRGTAWRHMGREAAGAWRLPWKPR